MPDPNVYPQFPGFPQSSNEHARPPREIDPRAGRLHPAVSRADQERGVGASNRQSYGPPPQGWPVGDAPLSPLKQRFLAGIRQIAEEVGGSLGPQGGIAVGMTLGLVNSRLGAAPDEAVAAALERFERLIHAWRTGEEPVPSSEPR